MPAKTMTIVTTQLPMTDALRNQIIEMAWDDDTSFDMIAFETGYKEPDVIKIMRTHMKTRSFRMWRKRVTGRKTKHSKL